MAIDIPTKAEMADTAIVPTLSKVVDYIVGLVKSVNDNDVVNVTTSYSGNVLTVNLEMGDGTTKSANVTIEGGGGGGGTGATVTNVTGSVTNNGLTLTLEMSDGSEVSGTVSGLVTSVSNAITGNSLVTTVNGVASTGVNVVQSVAGEVDENNNLKITINGVSSGDIPLGEMSTVGYDLTVNVTASDDTSIENVKVQAVDGEKVFTGTTNSEGVAHIIITENGNYTVSAVDTEQSTTASQEVGLSGSVTIDITSVTEMTLQCLATDGLISEFAVERDTESRIIYNTINASIFETTDTDIDNVAVTGIPDIILYYLEKNEEPIQNFDYYATSLMLNTEKFRATGTYNISIPMRVVPDSNIIKLSGATPPTINVEFSVTNGTINYAGSDFPDSDVKILLSEEEADPSNVYLGLNVIHNPT